VAEAAASAPPCRVRRSRRMVGKSYMIYIYDTGGAYGAPFAWPWQLHLLLSATAAAWPGLRGRCGLRSYSRTIHHVAYRTAD
jgi:hypothetical protein